MLKKAKIVNISLNSPQKYTALPIHLIKQLTNDHLQILNDQTIPNIVKDCIEAVNHISAEKKRLAENERKPTKLFTDPLKEPKKTEKQSGIRLSFKIAQSVEIILRKFILFQVQDIQQKMSSNYSRQKKIQQKSTRLYKTIFMRSNKENADLSTQQERTMQPETPLFKTAPKIDKLNQKLQSKITCLEKELVFCKEKLAEKCSLIAKLEARQCILKKKYHNQVQKMMRFKNILNINSLFQKEFEEKGQGKYLMNVSGKNLEVKQNMMGIQLYQNEKNGSQRVYVNKIEKKALKTSPTEGLMKSSTRKLDFLEQMQKISTEKSMKSVQSLTKKNSLLQKKEINMSKQASKINVLKRQLDQLNREKQRTLEYLTDSTRNLEKILQDLQLKIMQKQKEITVQQQLLTDQQLKMLKQEDFQTLQLTGFYDSTDNVPNETFE